MEKQKEKEEGFRRLQSQMTAERGKARIIGGILVGVIRMVEAAVKNVDSAVKKHKK